MIFLPFGWKAMALRYSGGGFGVAQFVEVLVRFGKLAGVSVAVTNGPPSATATAVHHSPLYLEPRHLILVLAHWYRASSLSMARSLARSSSVSRTVS